MLVAPVAAHGAARPRDPLLLLPLLLLVSLALAACGDPAGPGGGGRHAPDTLAALPRALTAAEREAVSAGNGFSLALLREVNARKQGGNVFISPLSASMALGMTANGAGGATEAAMRSTLGVPGQSAQQMNEAYRGIRELLLGLDPSVTIGVANSIWYRTEFPVLPSFVEASRTYFDAEVNAADFGDPRTVDRINAWAKAKTNDRITRVLDGLSDDDMLILMNALYFKGSWRSRFDASDTRPGPFTRDDGRVVSVPLMSREKADMRLGALADGSTVGELSYGNGAYVMTVLLPPPGTSVDAFVASLDDARWAQLLASLHEVSGTVVLPKFRVEYADKFNDVLSRLGMASAFCPNAADFTRLAAPPLGNQLCISFVKQNAFVDVNEEGTEAAAVTTVGVSITSVGAAPPELRVDRPFVFAIRERFSGALLFVGKVVEPGS